LFSINSVWTKKPPKLKIWGIVNSNKRFNPNELAQYVSGGYETINGMLQSGAASVIWSLIELQDVLGVIGNVAEIGVFQGRTLLMLCHALNQGEKAFGFDVFGIPMGSNKEWPEKLDENLNRFGLGDGTVSVKTVDSSTLAPEDIVATFGGASIRLFSIDGDHGVDGVLHDLNLAKASLAEGGLIIADDLFNAWYPTVTEALYKFLWDDPGDLEPIAMISANGPLVTGAGKLIIGRSSFANKYKAGLKILNRDDLKHCDPFAGFADVPSFYFEDLPQKYPLDGRNLEILNEILAK
jgi:hypothetical protein